MIEIIEGTHTHYGEEFDYHLNNGERLHRTEWNGEEYTIKTGATKGTTYKPIYSAEPNDNEGFDIIGFEIQ